MIPTALLALLLAAAGTAPELYSSAARHFDRHELADADRDVNQALHLDPAFVPALTLKAKLALAANRRDVAKSCLEKAVAVDPRSAYAQFLLGFFRYLENQFTDALPPLQAAMRLDPADSRAPFYLAMSLEGLGRPAAALSAYAQALQLAGPLQPQRAEILVASARLLFNEGRFADSEVQAREAVALAPASRDTHYQFGQSLLQKMSYPEAAAEGERALTLPAIGTSDAQVHFLLARAYLKLGDRPRADAHLKLFQAAPQTTVRH